jgi:hypothetical protein
MFPIAVKFVQSGVTLVGYSPARLGVSAVKLKVTESVLEQRMRGLLGSSLRLFSQGLLLRQQQYGLHTFGMRYAIDVIFLFREGKHIRKFTQGARASHFVCVRLMRLLSCRGRYGRCVSCIQCLSSN